VTETCPATCQDLQLNSLDIIKNTVSTEIHRHQKCIEIKSNMGRS